MSKNHAHHKEIIARIQKEEYQRTHPNECFCNKPEVDFDKLIKEDYWIHPVYGKIVHNTYICKNCLKELTNGIMMA